MTIIEHRCPQCAIKRTVRLGEWGAFCFNCRLQWGGGSPALVSEPNTSVPTGNFDHNSVYSFEPAELLRLDAYREAILKGLYTDWPNTCENAPSSPSS